MAQRYQKSIAHQYNDCNVCIWCGMYKRNVLALSHVCTPMREFFVDARTADAEKRRQEYFLAHGTVETIRQDVLEEHELHKAAPVCSPVPEVLSNGYHMRKVLTDGK